MEKSEDLHNNDAGLPQFLKFSKSEELG